ncbi:phosphatidylglycerophosphatase A [Acidiphilium multivorum]|uniref:Phosphatidylglycerophosphatase A n=2 Tax=Acidiphilium TaxID=522 RepID=A5FZS9_ACICJ|nr:phosphatidylglycerophosphatase A [Acidiphilium cryptum JF-5]EGO94867.1 Phosphatidylglycerophosphatase A [Acidiphilium sp. PM]MBS3023168.1 phosphatidylglycerophosphatase A [Acidiphilium multivorum]MBU6357521.1 phosphatidylglycerophosphatase A [Rhodospirillales bacterium]BAJ81500.1 phosphatidylglycerophosphatase A [Acidiphilium multivorum AIU301]
MDRVAVSASDVLGRAVASGLGIGFVPRAPGTAGALLGLLAGGILYTYGTVALAAGIVIASAAGMIAIPRTGMAGRDPGWIVIDEVAGQMIALLGLPWLTGSGVLLAFLLFRVFDIRKPWPISLADARHDALGIMADDWIAGAFAAIVLAALRLVWPGTGL